MVELFADLRLALEAVEEHRIGFHFGMRDLDGDLAAGAHVGSAKDGRHPAAGNDSFDSVVIELIAGVQ